MASKRVLKLLSRFSNNSRAKLADMELQEQEKQARLQLLGKFAAGRRLTDAEGINVSLGRTELEIHRLIPDVLTFIQQDAEAEKIQFYAENENLLKPWLDFTLSKIEQGEYVWK